MIDEMPEEPVLTLTETQRRILVALCRPCMGENRYATPATNQQIAAELFLSVDAIKAHLRALYRKFGVEPLPHNQKRARLVELALEGGIVSPSELSEEAPAAPPPPGPGRPRGRRVPIAAGAIGLIAAGVGAALLLSGGSDSSERAPSEAAYRAEVERYCSVALGRLAPASGRGRGDGPTAERATNYLGVLAIMRDRLQSLTPPAGGHPALERFRRGLDRATEFTDEVAQDPPRPGSRAGDNAVAELTLAAGQVQSGVLAYRLGGDCSRIGDVVARSARNAARAP